MTNSVCIFPIFFTQIFNDFERVWVLVYVVYAIIESWNTFLCSRSAFGKSFGRLSSTVRRAWTLIENIVLFLIIIFDICLITYLTVK